jgi:hypothetical protein
MQVLFDFSELDTAIHANPDYNFVDQTMQEASEVVMRAVKAALSGADIPGMTETVHEEKMAEWVRTESGTFEFTVSIPEEVKELEAPKGPWDMKPSLLNGPRHRVDKRGNPYNIVPFKHDKSELPSVVAEMASRLELSQIVGNRLEVRADDQHEIWRNTYNWGTNLGKQENRKFSNMYNFGNGKLITFRTVSTKSAPDSWIHPGRPGNPITESAWDFVAPTVETAITEAWERTLMAAWQ